MGTNGSSAGSSTSNQNNPRCNARSHHWWKVWLISLYDWCRMRGEKGEALTMNVQDCGPLATPVRVSATAWPLSRSHGMTPESQQPSHSRKMVPHASLEYHVCEEKGHQARSDLATWYGYVQYNIRSTQELFGNSASCYGWSSNGCGPCALVRSFPFLPPSLPSSIVQVVRNISFIKLWTLVAGYIHWRSILYCILLRSFTSCLHQFAARKSRNNIMQRGIVTIMNDSSSNIDQQLMRPNTFQLLMKW